MADKSTQLILDALNLAVLEPEGALLHGSRNTNALFPATAAAKQAALRCKEDGLVKVVRSETKGKSTQEFCVITEKGTAYLRKEAKPKELLEDFVRALEARNAQMNELVHQARSAQTSLKSLNGLAQDVLRQFASEFLSGEIIKPSSNGTGKSRLGEELQQRLAQWKETGVSEDCPLSELYQHVCRQHASITIGRFHDELRHLHDSQRIYLHPWTGPLYELPDPQLALLIGHEIVWYASLRQPPAA